MKDIESAKELAKTMKDLADENIDVKTIITSMNEPVGYSVGNSLEIKESVEILNGKKVEDVLEIIYEMVRKIYISAENITYDISEIKEKVDKVIQSKEAYNKLKAVVKEYGGDVEYLDRLIDDNNAIKTAYELPYEIENDELVDLNNDIYIKDIDAEEIAKAAFALGSGRISKEDKIDYDAGIVLKYKMGDKITNNTLCMIYTNKEDGIEEAKKHLKKAFTFSNTHAEKEEVILEK